MAILNDDSIILNSKGVFSVIGKEEVNGLIKPKPYPYDSTGSIENKKVSIIPYGATGFITYNASNIFLSNGGKQKILVRIRGKGRAITTVKLMSEELLLYSVEGSSLKVFDIVKNKEIGSISLPNDEYIGIIETLPYNRCLLVCGETNWHFDRIVICNLKDMTIEKEYEPFQNADYAGNFSNDTLPFFVREDDEDLLVYNILKKETLAYSLPQLDVSCCIRLTSVSPLDRLAVMKMPDSIHGSEVLIFG